MIKSILQRIKKGKFVKKIFFDPNEKIRPRVVPKGGMLVRGWHRNRCLCEHCERFSDYMKYSYRSGGVSLQEINTLDEYGLILEAIVDDYGYCKFKLLLNDKTEWTGWLTIEDFNSNWEILNPWL